MLESRHRIEQLHPHGTMFRSSMNEKQIAATTRMLDSVLDKLFNRTRLVRAFDLLCTCAKRECALFLLDADMTNAAVELHRQREDVVEIGAVAYNETSVGLVGENLLGRLGSQTPPIPSALKFNRCCFQLTYEHLHVSTHDDSPHELSQYLRRNPSSFHAFSPKTGSECSGLYQLLKCTHKRCSEKNETAKKKNYQFSVEKTQGQRREDSRDCITHCSTTKTHPFQAAAVAALVSTNSPSSQPPDSSSLVVHCRAHSSTAAVYETGKCCRISA